MKEEPNEQLVYFKINKKELFFKEEQENPSSSELLNTSICIEKGSLVQLRLVKVLLPSGQIEVLATNLIDKEAISLADLSDLYRQR